MSREQEHRHAFEFTGQYQDCVCGFTFDEWLIEYNAHLAKAQGWAVA